MKAQYHQAGKAPIECDAEKNPDGTLNLKRGNEVIVANCPASESPQDGHATLGTAKPAKDEKPAEEKAEEKPADDKKAKK